MTRQLFRAALIAAALLAMLAPGHRALAQARPKLDIVVFGAPSLGAFLTPAIKARKLDEANGRDIAFHERTPDAYTTQFNAGGCRSRVPSR